MTDDWVDLYGRVTEFSKLESVSLHFDRHAGNYDAYDDDNDEILHHPVLRSSKLLDMLNVVDRSIKDLSVRHIQIGRYKPDPPYAERRISSTLEGLRALRLSVVHEQPRGEAGPVYKVRREQFTLPGGHVVMKPFNIQFKARLTSVDNWLQQGLGLISVQMAGTRQKSPTPHSLL